MNPICGCGVKASRGWAYCPGCGDSIDWETKKEKAARKREHERKMETDPEYRKRHEMFEQFAKPLWDSHKAASLADSDPLRGPIKINILSGNE